MIVGSAKPISEISTLVKDKRKILIICCGGCATFHEYGGKKEAEYLKSELEKIGKIADVIFVSRECSHEILSRSLPVNELNNYDAVISLGCGVGTQVLAELTDVFVVPGVNTKFMGIGTSEKRFLEKCIGCGDCILHETGGICPLTLCAKGLLNGPCGGYSNGKCEVGGWKRNCAWVIIYERLKSRGELHFFNKFREPRNYKLSQHPNEFVRK